MFREINVHSIQDLEAVQESPLIARLVSKKRDHSDRLKALQHYKAMALEYLKEKYGSWPPPTTPPSQPEQPNDVEKLADQRAAAAACKAAMEELEAAQNAENGTVRYVPPPFLDFDDRDGWNGVFVGRDIVDDIAAGMWSDRREFVTTQLAGLSGQVLKTDFTYKIAEKIVCYHPDSGMLFKPFGGFASVVNEAGQVLLQRRIRRPLNPRHRRGVDAVGLHRSCGMDFTIARTLLRRPSSTSRHFWHALKRCTATTTCPVQSTSTTVVLGEQHSTACSPACLQGADAVQRGPGRRGRAQTV